MIRILILDDHIILVQALEMLIQADLGFMLLGSASCLSDGIELVRKTQPDILLLQPNLADGDGLSLLPYIEEISPKTKVVVLGQSMDDALLIRAINLGVKAYIPKDYSLSMLLESLRKTAYGQTAIPTDLLVDLVKRISRRTNGQSGRVRPLNALTARENEILSYLVAGKSGNEIAEELNIAPLTVRTHIRNLMAKLGVHTRLEAVSYAINQGIYTSLGA